MKFPALLTSSLVFAANHVFATPIFVERFVERSALIEQATVSNLTPNATQILQFALTLEHLESAFYTQALNEFNESAFENAGFPNWVRGRFVQIAEHEATHVEVLTKALGNDSVAACNYSFPFTDPSSFAALSETLESVGTSAYLGGVRFLTNSTDALQAAAAILTTEARHASWIESAVFESQPWSGPFDTPLSGNLVTSLAMGFITSCPSSNPPLAFTAYPNLTTSGSASPLAPGDTITLKYDNSSAGNQTQYLAFFSGLNTTFANISSSKESTIPEGLQGLVFAVVTTNNTAVSNNTVVAGPAPLTFGFGANATNF